MNLALIIIIVIAVILAIFGGLNSALSWLLWVALIVGVIALIVFPFLALLIYMIARGRGMAERQAHPMEQMRAQTDAHIRDVAGGTSATEQIAAAKGLLDSGAITSGEFEQIKRKALA